MIRIFLRIIRDKKTSIIVYSVAGILLLWMYVAMFPSIRDQAESLSELMQSYPEGFLEAFGIDEGFNFDRLENFVSIEHFSLIWPIIVIFMLVSFAGAGITGEIEKGTVEIPLSRPVSRIGIFFGRYLAGLFILLIFTIFSVFAVVPLANLHAIDYVFENYTTFAILGFLFGWAIFSLAMMFSAFFSEKSRVYMFIGSLLITMYVLNLIAVLKESFQDLKFLSFFYYYDYKSAVVDNTINSEAIWVFAAVIIFCTFIGAIWYKNRDIAV